MCELKDNLNKNKECYKFEELTVEAKEKAMQDRARYWAKCLSVDEVPVESNYYRAYKRCWELKAPELFVETVVEYCREEIIKELGGLKFTVDGDLIKE